MSAKPPTKQPVDDEQTVTGELESSTAPVSEAELETLESPPRQPLPPAPLSTAPECQRLVELVARLGNPAVDQPPANAVAEPNQRLGQYQLLEKLGEGGMGAVYKALHGKLEKLVALKVLPEGRLKNEKAVARFEREMRAVGKLNHPNIVVAHDAGEIDGHHYLVMELVDGCDLSELVRRCGPLPMAEACEVIRQAALGLQHAWSFGMVHRDIKPGNLMLTRDGQVKVLDMGLALLDEMRGCGAAPDLTNTGQLMGTLDYMAPEQGTDSHQVDIRADVYSLGATLFKLISGQPPFFGPKYESPLSKITALATEPARVLSDVREDVPAELSALVARMLSKQADERPATPQEVVELLAPFAAGARLDEVARLATKADERSSDNSSADTVAHLRRSFSPTDPALPQTVIGDKTGDKTVAKAAQPAAAAVPPRHRRRLRIATSAGLAAVLLLAAGLMFRLQTAEGEIVVTSDDPLVELAVRRHGEAAVKELELRQGQGTTTLRAGEYEIVVTGANADSFKIDPQQISLSRGDKVVVTVHRKLLKEERAEPKPAASGRQKLPLAEAELAADAFSPVQQPIPYTPPGDIPSDEQTLARLKTADWQPGEAHRLAGIVAQPAALSGLPAWQMVPHYALANQHTVRLSRSGRYFITEQPSTNLVIDLETNRVIGEHRGIAGTSAWSPDETQIAYFIDLDTTVHICGLDGAIHARFNSESLGPGDHSSHAAWSPDGSRIIFSSTERAEQRRPDGTLIESFVWPEKSCKAVWSPDGALFAVLDEQGNVQIYEPDGGEPVETIKGEYDYLRWAETGQQHLLAAGRDAGGGAVWSPEGLYHLRDVGDHRRTPHWAVSPDGRFTLTVDGAVRDLLGSVVSNLDIAKRISSHFVPEKIRWIEPDRIVYFNTAHHWLEYSPSGNLIAEHHRPAPLPFLLNTWLRDQETILSVYDRFDAPPRPMYFTWDVDGRGESRWADHHRADHGYLTWNSSKSCYAAYLHGNLFIIDHRGEMLYEIDCRSQLPLGEVPHGHFNRDWDPDGELFATGTNFGNVAIWKRDKLFALLKSGSETEGSVEAATWSPDGRYLVVTAQNGQDHRLLIWDIENVKTPAVTLNGQYLSPSWSPDSQYLAAGEKQQDGSYRLVLLTSQGEMKQSQFDANAIYPANWHPESSLFRMDQGLYAIDGELKLDLTSSVPGSVRFGNWTRRGQFVWHAQHMGPANWLIIGSAETKLVTIPMPSVIGSIYTVDHVWERLGMENFSPSQRWYTQIQNQDYGVFRLPTYASFPAGGHISLVDIEEKKLRWLGVGFSDGERVVVDAAGKLLVAPEEIDDYLVHLVGQPGGRNVTLNRLQFAARVGLNETQAFLQMLLDCNGWLQIEGRDEPLLAADVADARHLPPAEIVTAVNLAHNVYLDDEALQPLGGLSELQSLDLTGLPLTDSGLRQPLSKLDKLRALSLAGTKVTDSVSYHLPKSLEVLDVSGTEVGDFTMLDLAKRDFKSLRRLVVTGTKVTDQGIEALRAAMLECEIVW